MSPFSIVGADFTNGVVVDLTVVVAELTVVVAELTAVVAELDVADPTCRRRDRIPKELVPPVAASSGLVWAQYGIDLPGSLHTNKIPVILGRYPLLGFFCRLNIVPLDRDNGTFNSSNTDVVEKVNFLVAASQHGGTSVAEGSP